MQVIDTHIDAVKIIQPTIFKDPRGFFLETYHAQKLGKLLGLPDLAFVQDNHSMSTQGVLRGLHFQKTKPQGKLIRCVRGEIFDVAVDIRKGSITYEKSINILLNADNKQQLYIPPGFAHGFQVVSAEGADVEYKCTDYYDPSDEGCVIWNDQTLAIDWPLSNPTLSDKDAQAGGLSSVV